MSTAKKTAAKPTAKPESPAALEKIAKREEGEAAAAGADAADALLRANEARAKADKEKAEADAARKAADAASAKLVKMRREVIEDADDEDGPRTADVHPHQVSEWEAAGWVRV